MNAGKQVRLGRIFRSDGRAVIAALDHGIAGMSPLGHLESPRQLIPALAAAGIDAAIVTPGIASTFGAMLGRAGMIVRVDCGPTALTGEWDANEPARSVEDAVRLGADAVIAMGIVGAPGEAASLRAMARLAADCERWGVALVGEMLPGGFTAADVAPEHVATAARVGAELGADVIKIRYTGSCDSFRSVIAACYRPVIVLGGSRQDPDELSRATRDAITAGAVGVAVGRNIWQAGDPAGVASSLVATVHG